MDLNVEKMLTAAIADAQKSIVSPYTTTATVTSISGDTIFVRIPGSDNPTPIKASSVAVSVGDVVDLSVSHSDTHITGNRTDKAATSTVANSISKEHAEEVKEFIAAEYAKITELEAEKAKIKDLEAENVKVTGLLEADQAKIANLEADNVTIKGDLTAAQANIENLEANKATVTDLNAEKARIDDLEAYDVTVKGTLEANKAVIDSLDSTYASIDFSNIGKAAMEYFYANSGLIKDVIVGDQTITGKLVGVTISGDLIEGNTIKADKLVVKGSDGLFYKLNVDALGETTASSDSKYQNGIDGSVIVANSITAEKVAVNDLVAFGATIGGFHISDKSLYSGVKSGINNTTEGVYLGYDGQIYIGDLNNYIRYYKSSEDNKWKLDVSADNIRFGSSGKTIEQAIEEIELTPGEKGEDATLLRIESSRGTVFKNNSVSTVLSAVIYHGSRRITDADGLREVFGSGAYIEWSWQRMDENSFGVISASDKRIGNNGFTFTLTPDDVDAKVTFLCELKD